MIPKFVIDCAEKNRDGSVEPEISPLLFPNLLFSVQSDAEGSMMKSKVGESSSFIRSSVIVECLRQGSN